MKKIAIIAVLLILLIPKITLSQSKVGPYGGQFLLLSPSIRSNGMGQAGTALVDENSFYYNPGSLGLYYLRNEISITPWAGTNDLGGGIYFGYHSLSIPLLKHRLQNGSSIGLNCAFSYTKIKQDEIQETNYSQIIPGETFDWESQSFNTSVGFGYNGSLQIGGGVNLKYFDENSFSTGLSLDLGIIIRVPIGKLIQSKRDKYSFIVLPSFGFSHSNMGPLFKSGENEQTLTSVNRAGTALILGIKYKKYFGDWRLITLTPSLEYEKPENDNDISKYGFEVDFVEAFAVRLGKKDHLDITITTWGFTINSGGIFKLILAINKTSNNNLGKTLNFLTNRLTFQYFEAHFNYSSLFNDDTFRSGSIRYKLSTFN